MWFLCPTKSGTGEFLREGEREKEGDQRRLSKYYQLPEVEKHFFLFFFLNYEAPNYQQKLIDLNFAFWGQKFWHYIKYYQLPEVGKHFFLLAP